MNKRGKRRLYFSQVLLILVAVIFIYLAIALPVSNSLTKGAERFSNETDRMMLLDKETCESTGFIWATFEYSTCSGGIMLMGKIPVANRWACRIVHYTACNAIKDNPKCIDNGTICYNNPSDAYVCNKESLPGLCYQWVIKK